MEWINGEKGPECFCGMPTNVSMSEDGKKAWLICFFHTSEAGAMFPLPVNGKQENWPNINNDEIKTLVEVGISEQENLIKVIDEE